MTSAAPAGPLWLACLCAGWCRTCDGYRPVLDAVAAEFAPLQPRWIDIEDESDLVGDCDIQTFPTIAVLDAGAVRFFGPLTPQPETLRRVLRAALGHPAAMAVGPEIQAFAERLRQHQRID
jgi:thioredoxin-like negative regulator of GroEL